MLVSPKVRHLAAAVACLALAGPAAAQTVRVNTGLGGAEPDGVNNGGKISRDGRFVVFASQATNLVAGDTNASADVFVRDLAGASTARVSLAKDGLERSGASGLLGFDISADGRYSCSPHGRRYDFLEKHAFDEKKTDETEKRMFDTITFR